MMKKTGIILVASCLALGIPGMSAWAADSSSTSNQNEHSGGTAKGAAAGALAGHEMGTGHAATGAAVGAAVGHHDKKKANNPS